MWFRGELPWVWSPPGSGGLVWDVRCAVADTYALWQSQWEGKGAERWGWERRGEELCRQAARRALQGLCMFLRMLCTQAN